MKKTAVYKSDAKEILLILRTSYFREEEYLDLGSVSHPGDIGLLVANI